MQKLPRTRPFYCYVHEECSKCSLWWRFGPDISFDGVLVTIFVSHSFSCFNDLKLDNTITMATGRVSFDLNFMSFQKRLLLLTFNKEN